MTPLVGDPGHAQGDVDGGSVAPQVDALALPDALPGVGRLEEDIRLVSFALRKEQIERLPQRFFGPVAVQPPSPGVPARDGPLRAERQDGVVGTLHDRRELGLRPHGLDDRPADEQRAASGKDEEHGSADRKDHAHLARGVPDLGCPPALVPRFVRRDLGDLPLEGGGDRVELRAEGAQGRRGIGPRQGHDTARPVGQVVQAPVEQLGLPELLSAVLGRNLRAVAGERLPRQGELADAVLGKGLGAGCLRSNHEVRHLRQAAAREPAGRLHQRALPGVVAYGLEAMGEPLRRQGPEDRHVLEGLFEEGVEPAVLVGNDAGGLVEESAHGLRQGAEVLLGVVALPGGGGCLRLRRCRLHGDVEVAQPRHRLQPGAGAFVSTCKPLVDDELPVGVLLLDPVLVGPGDRTARYELGHLLALSRHGRAEALQRQRAGDARVELGDLASDAGVGRAPARERDAHERDHREDEEVHPASKRRASCGAPGSSSP